MDALPHIGQEGQPARLRLVIAVALSALAVAIFAWVVSLREHVAVTPPPGTVQPALQRLATRTPSRPATVIVRFAPSTTEEAGGIDPARSSWSRSSWPTERGL
jgi:hypothetical protein